MKRYWSCRETKQKVHILVSLINYHSDCEHSSRFLNAESFDHLEHIHHSLCLTHLNSIQHTNTTHCVTKNDMNLNMYYMHDIVQIIVCFGLHYHQPLTFHEKQWLYSQSFSEPF